MLIRCKLSIANHFRVQNRDEVIIQRVEKADISEDVSFLGNMIKEWRVHLCRKSKLPLLGLVMGIH